MVTLKTEIVSLYISELKTTFHSKERFVDEKLSEGRMTVVGMGWSRREGGDGGEV